MRTILLVFAALSLLAGPALAHERIPTHEATGIADLYVPDQGDINGFATGANAHDVTIYQETNGCDGLQTDADDLRDDHCALDTPTDERVASLEGPGL